MRIIEVVHRPSRHTSTGSGLAACERTAESFLLQTSLLALASSGTTVIEYVGAPSKTRGISALAFQPQMAREARHFGLALR
jgi:hypothetical protein